MHHYLLENRHVDNTITVLKGKAQDTFISDKKEFLAIEINSRTQKVQPNLIKEVTALDDSAVY